jgi:hypothetical protein
MPSQLEMTYTVVVKEGPHRRTIERSVGQFAGTRGRAAPVVGLQFLLSGALASQYRLQADALFLGALVNSKSGHDLNFCGPTGSEPLVGLRLTVCDVETQRATAPVPEDPPVKKAANKPLRQVRVYRPSKGQSDASQEQRS